MIEIDAITKRYDDRPVVNAVSLVVDPHTLTVIVGTSGSGKTTLLRMINRLVEPSAGTIRIDGKDHRTQPPHILRRGIGYVIQGNGLFPHRTVGQNIATVPVLSGWDKPRVARRVDELLSLFQLDPAQFRDRYPHQLSGGQKQRVGVARALAVRPNILLMDEPFGALDPVIRGKAQIDLVSIQKQLGTTIVLVTHDMEEAIQLGDRIAVMDDGNLLQYATPAEILAYPATEFVETLIGSADRPFRYLSLSGLGDIVESGTAQGAPLPATASRRDALAELLWSGRAALPVTGSDGAVLGRVTRETLMRLAKRPA
ncbi:MAG: ABC transporter ATP-binding protein [Rhizobiales bacterium]|nr:ABC transporter ATP-binding protein [Hyphomicrobiales bacterium]